jgi:hypothetical protein
MEKVAPMSGAEQPVSQETTPEETAAATAAAFEAGFNDDEDNGSRATETPPEPEALAPEPSPTPAPSPAPEYVQVTKEDWDRVSQTAAKITEIEATVGKMRDTTFGKIGGLERTLATLQQQTPSGAAVELSDEDFAEMKAEYPELSELTRNAVNKALGRLKGTGGAPVDTKVIATEVREAVQSEVIDSTLDAILDGDWREEVKKPAYAEWFKTQDAEVQKLGASDKLRDAARLMRKFKAHLDAPAPVATPAPTKAPTPPAAPAAPAQPSMRSRQVAAAMASPRDGGTPPTSKAKTPFEQGFEAED